MFRSWWQRLVGGKFPPLTQSARKSRDRVRPGLEQLEDRCVPATFTVTNLNDSGTGSLREAIAFANDETNNPGADTIVFQSGLSGQMNLSTAGNTTFGPSAFLITSTITIDGFSGGGSVVLARSVAATNLRLFRVDVGANLSLDGLTVKGFKLTGFNGSDGGYGGGGGGGAGLGGAILNQGTLTITRCLFQNNEAIGGKGGGVPDVTSGGGGGGGLSGAGGTVSGSTGGAGGLDGGGAGGNFSGGNGTNGGFGGGGGGGAASLGQAGNGGMGGFGGGGGGAGVNGDIALNGTYGVGGYGGGQGGAVQSNTGGVGGGGAGMGGGIFNWGGTLTITNSTFHNNKAQGGAKGTLSFGTAGATNGAGFGGAVFSYNGSVTSRNNTFSNNIADQGGGVYHLGDGATATSTVKNTILANSSGSGNDYFHDSINAGSVTLTLNNNVIERHQVGLSGVVSTADPGLGALQNNGGPTSTMAITSASNAYNAGNDSDATGLSTDQRGTGFARLVGVVDIGAFELAPSLPPAPSTPDLSAGSDSGPSTTDNNTNDNTPTFTGTAQANSTVKLFSGATQIGSTTANGSGNWTITASSLSDGGHSITATATNADGTGPASSALSITIDTQTPATPSISSFSQDSGTTGDNITNDNTITLNGTADPNSTITVFDGATQLGTATANGSGNWTYTTGTLSNAVHNFTAKASDTAGNQSGASSALSVTVDTSVNASNLSFADDSGAVGDGITNDATVTLSGTADPFSSVRVIVDYTIDLETTTADAQGNWSVQATLTSTSTNVYYAIVTDVAGNSTTTAQLSIVLDTQAPSAPTISGFSDDTGASGDAVTNDTTLTLSGSAEGLSTVTIYDGSNELGTTTANEMGLWSYTTTTLSDDAHSFTATASDAAGNASSASTALVVTVDTQAPSVPSITGYSQDSGTQGDNRTNDATITLSGTADPNSTVTVFDGASELGTTTADGSGNWTYTTSSLSDTAHSFTAKSSDVAGNQSSASTALVVTVDTQAPSVLSITGYSQDSGTQGDNRTNDATITLSGTAEPNSTIAVFDGATQLGTTTADGSGAWSYTTSTLSDDAHSFTATATDAAGNTSNASAALSVTIDTQAPNTPSITGFSQDSGTSGDSRTNDDTVTLSGTAEPNSTVTVFDGASELGTTTVDGSGNWSYTTSSRSDGTHSFTATATDAAGNQSSASSALVVTIDTQAPTAPSITGFSQDSGVTGDSRTNDATITLSGTAEPNSTVTVFDGASELGTATADGSGDWSYTTGTLGDGTHSFTATATDAAGNTSVASSALSVTIDTEAPNAPSITGYSQDSGTTGDNTTNDNTVTLSGTTEVNSTVVVFDGATQLGTATVDGSGNWNYTTSALSDGAHSFTAVATDAAGNQGVVSTALTVTVDTLAPSTPAAPEVADDDAPIYDALTADDTLSLSGMAEVGATVTIFDGATQLGTVVATDGTWQFTTNSLADGQHSFTVTATDVAGNTSSGSTAVVVEVDTTPPAVPTISGYTQDTGTEADGITSDNTVTLTGTADPNTTVTVLDGTTALGTATVDAQGAWSYTTATLGDATHSFTATAFDAAYNTSAASASLSVTVDTLAPSAPAIAAYQVDSGVSGDGITNANPLALSGTAEHYSTITVLDGVNVLGSTTANAQGAWTFTTPELSDGAHSFTATATDAAGNTSVASSALTVTVDTQAPNAPSVTGFSQDSGTTGDRLTNDATLTLSGSAEPNSTVTVFDGANELGTTTANGSGNWSYTTSTLGDGSHSFTASATDAAGNQGSASSAFVVSIDTDAPNAPSITGYSQDSGTSGDNLTNDSTITLSGTAESNSTVTVFDGTTQLGTATATAQGNWTYTTAALSEGLHNFTTTATDAADNTSVASSSLSVTTDTQAPIAPAVTGFSQDSGTLGDNITSDTTVTLTGTAEPNSLVTLFDGMTLLGSNQADAQGAWSMTTAVLSEGVHSFTVTATDAADNTSVASTALSVTVDSQAPNAPAVTGFSQDSGATGDNLTNDNTLTLSGTAEPNSTVTIFDGANQLGTATADAQGDWSFTTGSLSDGSHSFSATARDAAGNLSVASTSFAVTIDTQTPDAPGITSYSQDTGAADGLTSDTTLTLVGSAEPLSTVTVFDGATQLGTTTANAQGVWSYTTAVLQDGAHSLAALATDAAGNQSVSSAVLAVQVDTVAPVVQSIESVGPSTVVSSTMQFTVTFNRPVTGVNLGDFQATTTGTLSGVTPTNLQGAGAVYTVTVSVGSGSGTVRLDVTDDDSIRAVNDVPLAGAFTTGEVVSRRKAPTLTALDAPKGSGVVQVFNPDGSPRFNLTPYAGHTKGVDAAVGDVNGDGFSDVVTGVSRGGPPTVKVFDGLTGAELRTIVAFKATFTGGVSVAAGDVNGDGRADIIVGAGLDHGPKVNVYSGLDGSLIKSFLAYGTDFTGGVRVAAGDVNGDGRADVVTSQLSGAAMMVKVFSGLNFTVLDKIQPFGPFELSKTALAVGDFNNDGRADIAVIGGTQPLLRIYNGDSLVERASLKAFSALDGGLWLTAGDVNGDDVVDLIAVTGSNLEMRVKHFNGLTLAQLDNFFAAFPAV